MNIGTTTTNIQAATTREKTLTIKPPMPDSALWHQTTQWRHAEKLYNHYPHIWKKLKKENAIPVNILAQYEK